MGFYGLMKRKRIPSFLLLNQPASRYELPCFEEAARIPKMIHQTYPSRILPEEVEENIAALKTKNPGWEYRLYDDDDIERFIGTNYGEDVLGYYHRINPCYGVARADFFRYLLMYRQGGVYLDIKSTASQPLDEVVLPDDRLILSHWSEDFPYYGRHREFKHQIDGGEFQQWHIICAPGHTYLRQVIQFVMRNIDCYVRAIHGTGHLGVWRVAGPIAYTMAILPLLPTNKHRIVASHKDIGLVYSYYKGDHRNLFKANYRHITEPVVPANTRGNVLSSLCAAYDWLHGGR
jgi:mannosyltransferase OCH1-like enzyme